MSETARAVGRDRTTVIMEYIEFSSNVELILRWDMSDQVLGEMKDIQMPSILSILCLINKAKWRLGFLSSLVYMHAYAEMDRWSRLIRLCFHYILIHR